MQVWLTGPFPEYMKLAFAYSNIIPQFSVPACCLTWTYCLHLLCNRGRNLQQTENNWMGNWKWETLENKYEGRTYKCNAAQCSTKVVTHIWWLLIGWLLFVWRLFGDSISWLIFVLLLFGWLLFGLVIWLTYLVDLFGLLLFWLTLVLLTLSCWLLFRMWCWILIS